MSSSSRHILSAGIFSSEPGQRLLTICDTLSRRAFHGLYTKCKDNVQGSYYQTGLKRVHVWSDDIVNEDIDFVRNTCPDIDETYEMCFVNYVEERYRGNQRPIINCPSLIKFVRHFLESVALHEHLQTAEFFTTRDVVQKRITCMDACRQAFYSLVNADSVRVELESVVSRGTAPLPVAPVVRAPPRLSTNVILDSEDSEILPSDSISQIDVPRSVVSHASLENDRRSFHPQRAQEDEEDNTPSSPMRRHEFRGKETTDEEEEEEQERPPLPPPSDETHHSTNPSPPMSYISTTSSQRKPSNPSQENSRVKTPQPHSTYQSTATSHHKPHYPSQENLRADAPPPPSSYISTASSTSRRRRDDSREQRRDADDAAVRTYKPELLEVAPSAAASNTKHHTRSDARSDVSRHDFELADNGSVASLRSRSVVGSRDSSVSIGIKRLKSPQRI